MNYDEAQQIGNADMRGAIHTHGIEDAAGAWADALAGPFNTNEHARIRGAFLAAFEAGRLYQLTIMAPLKPMEEV